MMVVIGIIAVLVSLLTSAVIMALRKIDESRATTELRQIESGITQFEADFNMQTSPPPSRLYIDESGQYNPAANVSGFAALTAPQQAALIQMAADSKAYLSRVWPRPRRQRHPVRLEP